MEHPFLKNIRFVALYFFIWILYSFGYFSFLHFYFHRELFLALIDSLVFNIILSFLCLPIWYIVRFEKLGSKNIVNVFISQITSLVFFILVWLGAGYVLFKVFFHTDTVFFENFKSTVPYRIFEGVSIFVLFNLMYYIIIYNRKMQEKIATESLLHEKIKEAELNLLKSQINPHFLFNSLNSVSSLTMTSPEKAQEMIILLSDYLRYSVLNRNSTMPTLRDEIENIKKYLEIEKVRFGQKLLFSFHIPEINFIHRIPVMILQPIYENAVKHGVYESTQPVEISTNCVFENNNLYIYINNNFEQNGRNRSGAGIGLANIRERLRLIFGTDQLLKFNITENMFEVTIIIPQNIKN